MSSQAPASVRDAKGLHLVTQSTPNGVQVALEELKDAYETEWTTTLVDISTNEQKLPWFIALNPNGRIPVLVDNTVQPPFSVMESGAELLYLAKKYDLEDKFGFKDEFERNDALQWLFFQNAGVGPMQGQYNHFNNFAPEKIPYAIKRYHDETLRLYEVLELRLTGKYNGSSPREYLAGAGKGKYSWADISTFPWVNISQFSGLTEDEIAKFPAVKAWLERILARPAVKRGLNNYKKQG